MELEMDKFMAKKAQVFGVNEMSRQGVLSAIIHSFLKGICELLRKGKFN